MSSATAAAAGRQRSAHDSAWGLLLAASALAHDLQREGGPRLFGEDGHGGLRPLPADAPDALLSWNRRVGWESKLSPEDPRTELLKLYLPICSATAAHPVTVGHLGQSLDGFIATPSGDSQFVTGSDNIVHVHRMRALCDAVVVGAGTVAVDDPQLTTRHVTGPSPLRVVFDPERRLAPTFRVFTDHRVPTIHVCARSRMAPDEDQQGTALAGVDHDDPADLAAGVLQMLHERGCSRIFVEGGGVTVSTFLAAGLLDRLHLAIAPVLIGEGRPAVRLPPQELLRNCRWPAYRVFRMGGDVLFDCELRRTASRNARSDDSTVTQII